MLSSPDYRRMEVSMNPSALFTTMLIGLTLLLNITPRWAQPVCAAPGGNPTASDADYNTAGGTAALGNLGAFAGRNTAFGRNALFSNSAGTQNTANGARALQSN